MRCAVLISRMLLLILVLIPLESASAREDLSRNTTRRHRSILERRSQILEDLRFELREVSDWCHKNGMPQAAADVTQLAMDLTTDGPRTQPPQMAALPVSPTLPESERQWRAEIQRLRQDRAGELYILARRALRAGLPSVAYRLVGDVLRLDPDQVNARSIIGQQLFHDPLRADDSHYAGEWVSAWEAARRGGAHPEILHEQFGWIPRAHVARYEGGMRPWKGSWISSEKEQETRRDFRNAWEIESEHFLVLTNVGLEEGVVLSRQLELYYDWLRQNFAAFFETPGELRTRFEQAHVRRRRSRPQAPMKVCYFATREEYQRRVRDKVPPGLETNGLYWQPDRTCYFFRNEQRDGLDTLFHEATHQILDVPSRQARVAASRALARKQRRRPQEWILGGRSGFWLIEGLACYVESFEVSDGAVSVGRPDHIRIVAAERRLLRDNFFVPLEVFCRLGKDEFQQHPNVMQLYSQASGLAHFLMHYDDGRYRDDLVRLLTARYRPNARNPLSEPTLSDVTGVPFMRLDQQYREHMANVGEQIRQQQADEARQQEEGDAEQERVSEVPVFNRLSRPDFFRGQQ